MSPTSSATATTLSTPGVGAPQSTMSVDAVAATGHGSPGSLHLELSAQTDELFSDENGLTANLRRHPRIAQLLSIYSSVVLVSLRAYVFQTRVYGADDVGHAVSLVRFGMVPRGLSFGAKNAKGVTQTVVPFIPSLRCIATTTNQTATAECAWGVGGAPFPPGLQLDLAAVEVRHHYPEFALCNAGALTKEEHRRGIAQAQLDFTVECSGQNFGSIY